jgi:prepilin-type processing-associated H-X9-DG protein
MGIIATLMALLLPAIQRCREAVSRVNCQNQMKQLACAVHQFHTLRGALPSGWQPTSVSGDTGRWSGWLARLLPYVEQTALAEITNQAYTVSPDPFNSPPHIGLMTTIQTFGCPADTRVLHPQQTTSGKTVAFSSYLGVSGVSTPGRDGVLFPDSRITFSDIGDGLSQTLLIGERPPSADLQFGWWYAGLGQTRDGSCDQIMGILESNRMNGVYLSCGAGTHRYGPGKINDPCAVFHFWSLHLGGANFAFCDGSVRLIPYSIDTVIGAAFATRFGNESYDGLY